MSLWHISSTIILPQRVSFNLAFMEVRRFLPLPLVFPLQVASQMLIMELRPSLFMTSVPSLLEPFPCSSIPRILAISIFTYPF